MAFFFSAMSDKKEAVQMGRERDNGAKKLRGLDKAVKDILIEQKNVVQAERKTVLALDRWLWSLGYEVVERAQKAEQGPVKEEKFGASQASLARRYGVPGAEDLVTGLGNPARIA